ncbi:hypothetical protein CGRA01v4_06649 [Colletotrichum graminicola]|nr:hypothetical protein CGRA01v4_06649 [Colletotrichum graminicola]
MRLVQLCQTPPTSVSHAAWSRRTPCTSSPGKPFAARRHQGTPSSEKDIFCRKVLRAPQAIQPTKTHSSSMTMPDRAFSLCDDPPPVSPPQLKVGL